jgi:hypothetical protein
MTHAAEPIQLAGVAEAAELLGVSKQRVSQLALTAGFPKPIGRARCGPIWRRDDVEQEADRRRAGSRR